MMIKIQGIRHLSESVSFELKTAASPAEGHQSIPFTVHTVIIIIAMKMVTKMIMIIQTHSIHTIIVVSVEEGNMGGDDDDDDYNKGWKENSWE